MGASPGDSSAPFGSRTRWLVLAALLSLCASAALGMFADLFEVPSSGADAFSRSAIGHHAFVRLLRALGRNVIVSRSRTAEKAKGAVVVVAEPLVGRGVLEGSAKGRLQEIVAQARGVLLVLPKRIGFADPLRPSWLKGVELDPPGTAEEVLEFVEVVGSVVRPGSVAGFEGALPAPELSEPQLIVSSALVPLLSSGGRALVGERIRGGSRLIVLGDPDIIETHGLGRGRNAELVAAILDRLDPEGRLAIVVDETLHGHEIQPSLTRELLSWPLALATIQAGIALALLAWAGLVRFGRARQASAGLALGKEFLIENTAALLRHGRHLGPAVGSYWRAAKDEIVRALQPPGERPADPDAFVARVAAARGRKEEFDALERRVAEIRSRRPAEQDVLRAALDIHAFREVMTHGARSDR